MRLWQKAFTGRWPATPLLQGPSARSPWRPRGNGLVARDDPLPRPRLRQRNDAGSRTGHGRMSRSKWLAWKKARSQLSPTRSIVRPKVIRRILPGRKVFGSKDFHEILQQYRPLKVKYNNLKERAILCKPKGIHIPLVSPQIKHTLKNSVFPFDPTEVAKVFPASVSETKVKP